MARYLAVAELYIPLAVALSRMAPLSSRVAFEYICVFLYSLRREKKADALRRANKTRALFVSGKISLLCLGYCDFFDCVRTFEWGRISGRIGYYS